MMENQIILIDELKNETSTTADKYILRFDSGANISFECKVTHTGYNLVCRSWCGDNEWEPSLEVSCNLLITPHSGCCIWLNPVILTGKSLVDVMVKATSNNSPQLFSCTDNKENLVNSSIKAIKFKDYNTKLFFKIELPDITLSPFYRESILISTLKDDGESKHQAILCEPKAANLWVFKHLGV